MIPNEKSEERKKKKSKMTSESSHRPYNDYDVNWRTPHAQINVTRKGTFFSSAY